MTSLVSAGDSHTPAPGDGTSDDPIAAAEALLARGDSAAAWAVLSRVAAEPIAGPLLQRFATAFAAASRYVTRQDDVLAWADGMIAAVSEPRQRASLLRARIAVCRQVDTARCLELADEALAAAELVDDEEAIASVLSHGAFAAYRRGDARRSREFAAHAAGRAFSTRAGQYDAARAQMFAATIAGELELVLQFNIKARALARERGHLADQANESNNLAEIYLELGCPHEARACAEAAGLLARAAGYPGLEAMATVYQAIATAEVGDIDGALVLFAGLPRDRYHRFSRIDGACFHAYWLLERGAAGDARVARETAAHVLDDVIRAGADQRLTAVHSCLARAHVREGCDADARDHLERARKAADRADPTAESMLALAAAEVLPAAEPQRQVVLSGARARILRRAARREDPHAFCVNVRLNRRLLELSGGVPADLPRSQ
jgi:sulfur transfer complex TusBCD TusB component (DsrH family)